MWNQGRGGFKRALLLCPSVSVPSTLQHVCVPVSVPSSVLYCSVPSVLQYVYRYESLLSSSSNPIQILPGKSLEDHTRRMTRSTIPQNVTNISVHTKSVDGCRDLYKSLSLVTIVIVSRHGKINLIRRSVQFQSGSILPGHDSCWRIATWSLHDEVFFEWHKLGSVSVMIRGTKVSMLGFTTAWGMVSR